MKFLPTRLPTSHEQHGMFLDGPSASLNTSIIINQLFFLNLGVGCSIVACSHLEYYLMPPGH